jgi:hypothetical protein
MMMLNNLIGFRDLVMFMFGCKEDEDLLLNGIRPKRVNTTIVSRETVMTRFVFFKIISSSFAVSAELV